jgi:hypothetical protein
MAHSHNPDLPSPKEIAIATAVRQCPLHAAQNSAPIQALVAFIGFGSVTFKTQDHRIIRALVETSEKARGTSP